MMYVPFVIMFLMLGLLIFVARRRTNTTKPVFFYGNRIKLMFIGYVMVLLLSVGIYFFLPSSDGTYSEHVGDEEIPELYLYASGELPISDIHSYLKGKKEFAYESDTLNIETIGYADELFIRVEKDDTLDGKIEASYYKTPTIVHGLDVSVGVPSIRFYLSDQSLEVFMQDHVEINVTVFKNEFPFTQFLNESGMSDDPGSVIFPQQILHLNVPEHVSVHGAEHLNIFLDE